MNQLSDEMQALYRRTGTAMLNRFMACESLTATDIGAEIPATTPTAIHSRRGSSP
jgi:hypothetical protein